MSVRTQGTQVFFIDPTGGSPTVVAVECATAHNTGGAPADQIDDTCLEDTTRKFRRGLRTPGQATISINFDPQFDSHMKLAELVADDEIDNIEWAVGWSDGPLDSEGKPAALPTVDSNGDWELPNTRSWLNFQGYVADLPFDFQLNAVVTSEVSVQRSGPTIVQRKVVA